jgi:hypothetical protein
MSRYTNYQDERLTVVSDNDIVLGRFILLFDNNVETPEGDGLILHWSVSSGTDINFTGIPTSNDERDVMNTVEKYLKEIIDY